MYGNNSNGNPFFSDVKERTAVRFMQVTASSLTPVLAPISTWKLYTPVSNWEFLCLIYLMPKNQPILSPTRCIIYIMIYVMIIQYTELLILIGQKVSHHHVSLFPIRANDLFPASQSQKVQVTMNLQRNWYWIFFFYYMQKDDSVEYILQS